jgi:hypothetical protein
MVLIMDLNKFLNTSVFVTGMLLLSACGGGGGSDPAPPAPLVNGAPSAYAGTDQTVIEFDSVSLDGSASTDPENDTITFAWTQTAGTTVTIADDDMAMASFDAPDVTTSEILTFQLTVDDGSGSAMDSVDVTVEARESMGVVAGVVSFEFALPNANCRGLNLDNPEVRPIRGITVQLFDSTDVMLDTTTSAGDGSYSFSDIDANLDVYVRVRAELKSTAPAAWDVEVRDNVDTSALPLPIGSRSLYVVDFAQFNTGASNISDANFTATTGWDGSAYTGPRMAAPFAILDAIMDGMEMITAVDPTATFPPLDAFWSVNNTVASPSDRDAGELSASFYDSRIDSLFLLGDAATDTEEFDDHVSMHEWGHYFEDNFSRSDSIGGSHSIGESLDPRLAFGEGFATALAAIALQNPQYCDTSAPLESSGFRLDTENDDRGEQGFYNEMSVATLLNDLVDTAVDGSDNGSVGFAPIYSVMTGAQVATEAFTSLFSFATELRNILEAGDLAFVDSQLARENIDVAGLNIYGDAQTTVPAGSRDVLPVYTVLPTDGTVISICTNSDFDTDRDGNTLSEHRFLKFTTTGNSTYNVSVTANPVPPTTSDPAPTPPDELRDRSDPDVFIWRDGILVATGTSGDDDAEVFITENSLPANEYVMSLQEFRYSDEDGASSDFPEQVCFDISMSP